MTIIRTSCTTDLLCCKTDVVVAFGLNCQFSTQATVVIWMAKHYFWNIMMVEMRSLSNCQLCGLPNPISGSLRLKCIQHLKDHGWWDQVLLHTLSTRPRNWNLLVGSHQPTSTRGHAQHWKVGWSTLSASAIGTEPLNVFTFIHWATPKLRLLKGTRCWLSWEAILLAYYSSSFSLSSCLMTFKSSWWMPN